MFALPAFLCDLATNRLVNWVPSSGGNDNTLRVVLITPTTGLTVFSNPINPVLSASAASADTVLLKKIRAGIPYAMIMLA